MAVLSSKGVAGWIAAAAFVGGWAASITWLAIAGAGAMLGLIVREVAVSTRAMTYLQRQLQLASHAGGAVHERLLGTHAGSSVQIVESTEAITVTATLPGWPRALAVVAERAAPDAAIGDPDFDAALAVTGPEELWRSLFTPPVRDALRELLGGRTAAIRDGTYTAEYRADSARGAAIHAHLDGVLALARTLAAAPVGPAHVLAALRGEPATGVRFGHIRWLLDIDHERIAVLRLAAADRDPYIQLWAAEHVPPEGGAYR